MKFVTRPPADANGVGHGGDDLDEALFAFFRSEMPHPWPQLQLPNGAPPAPTRLRLAPPAPAPSRRPWFRSPRFALAASVALLVGGYSLMSSALTPPPPSEQQSSPFDSGKNSAKGIKDLPPDDDDVDVDLRSIDMDGTIHMKAYKRK